MNGRNVQAYVDNMVVTSTMTTNHWSDLEELFVTIGKYQLKLNHEKCVFGVKVGKFLDFLLTNKGKDANPNKCYGIINLRSPSNVKEVQRLTGWLMTLSCFLSKGGDKSFLYF